MHEKEECKYCQKAYRKRITALPGVFTSVYGSSNGHSLEKIVKVP